MTILLNPVDIEAEFGAAMSAYGLNPPEIVADGKRRRFDADDDKRGKKSAWYVLYGDGVPAGAFGNWKTSLSEKWSGKSHQVMTAEERREYGARIEKAKQDAEVVRLQLAAEAKAKCATLWAVAQDAGDDNPYCVRKGVKPYGLKEFKDKRTLIVPIRDSTGALTSLQFIDLDGAKRFKSHGKVAGCYYIFGGQPVDTVLMCEGFATGASIHAVTGSPVAVAFNAGNLEPVARVLRETLPEVRIIVCADNDRFSSLGNVGIAKARAAALAVDGFLAVPVFSSNDEKLTDFNDLHQADGAQAVIDCIASASGALVEGEIGDGESAPSNGKNKANRISNDSIVSEYGGGTFDVSHRGVYFIGTDKDGNEVPPKWLCSKLIVVAKTRDAKSGEWGRLLEWHDDDRIRHQWAMPLELLQSDGTDMRRELARMGLSIAPTKVARDLLASFVQVWPVEDRARCVERLGWHGSVYVTPSESIGQDGELVVFQNAHAIEPAFSAAGTLEQWRDSVAALAVGNSRLVFALSVAFAGALADIAGEDSGGFHLRGGSSSGKTTALKVAASVWGNPNAFPRLWRATANGLEGLAALHNDGLLILDELSQIDPKEAGEAAYLLANGQGKARASRTGAARQSARWRLLFLSAGEESLTALMARAGKKTNAGQEIRLADIDADAGAGMGAFENLHDQTSPAALALTIKDSANKFHGTAGVAWLRRIVADRPNLADIIGDGMRQFVEEVTPRNAAGQVQRVARRFALVAVAGELATYYGLTGWPEGEATNAAKKCFAVWLDSFGGSGNREDRAVLSQVRAFFEAHGASRFEDVNADKDQRIINRAGFYRTGPDDHREYMVLSEAFKREVCQGFDEKTAIAVLITAGWVQKGKDGRPTQKPRLPVLGPTRCYVFTARMWEGD